jgi:hypothetical protein
MSKSSERFTFSIRDLIWLLLVTGVASGWLAQSMNWNVRWNALHAIYEAEQKKWQAEGLKEMTARHKAEFSLGAARAETEMWKNKAATISTAEMQTQIAKRDVQQVLKQFAELKKELRLVLFDNAQLREQLEATKKADKQAQELLTESNGSDK